LDCPELLKRFKGGLFPDTQEIRIFPKGAVTKAQLSQRLASVYDNPLKSGDKDRAVSEANWSFIGDTLLFGHGDSGIDSRVLSLRETSNNNSQAGLIPLEGFSEILPAFSTYLRDNIRLNSVVELVSCHNKHKFVYTKDTDKPFVARSVVVTTSLGVLQAGIIKFTHKSNGKEKKFTPHTIKALLKHGQLDMGCFEKVHFLVSGYNNLLISNDLKNDYHIHIYDPDLGPMLLKTHTDGNKPVLTCYLGAEIAKNLLTEGGEKKLTVFALNLARKHLGHFDVQASICSNWLNDPLFLGSYSAAYIGGYDRRDVTVKNQKDLRDYGLFFAGEAIPAKQLSLATQVPGALVSGEHAANELTKYLGISRELLYGSRRGR
jgi:hypothetical protein